MLETISIGGSQEEEPTEDQAVNISISTIWCKLLFITAFIWYLHLGLRSLFRPNIKTTVTEMAQAKTAYTGSRCWGWIFGMAPVLPPSLQPLQGEEEKSAWPELKWTTIHHFPLFRSNLLSIFPFSSNLRSIFSFLLKSSINFHFLPLWCEKGKSILISFQLKSSINFLLVCVS